MQLRNAPTSLMKKLGFGEGYAYAHDAPEGVTPMECLPDRLRGRQYYEPTARGHEARYRERLEKIRAWRDRNAETGDDEGERT